MMKLKHVAPGKIMIPEIRVTSRFDDETLALFQRSIKESGLVAPIIGCEIDGQIVLIDGLHRLQEAIANRLDTIDVAVVEGDMTDVLARNIYLDHLRGKHPVSDMVKVIGALTAEYRLDSDAIAAKTGLTRDYVEKLQTIAQLTPYCLAALDDERIKVGHAAALTKIKDPVKQEAVCSQQLMYRWSVKDFEAYVLDVLKLIEAPPPTITGAAPPPPMRVKCMYCSGTFEPQEVANPNTCRECSLIMFQATAEIRSQATQAAAANEKQSSPTTTAPGDNGTTPAPA